MNDLETVAPYFFNLAVIVPVSATLIAILIKYMVGQTVGRNDFFVGPQLMVASGAGLVYYYFNNRVDIKMFKYHVHSASCQSGGKKCHLSEYYTNEANVLLEANSDSFIHLLVLVLIGGLAMFLMKRYGVITDLEEDGENKINTFGKAVSFIAGISMLSYITSIS